MILSSRSGLRTKILLLDVEWKHVLLLEQEFDISACFDGRGSLEHLHRAVASRLPEEVVPVRFVITSSGDADSHCEVGVISGLAEAGRSTPRSIFEFRRRPIENTNHFNVVLLCGFDVWELRDPFWLEFRD